jgi:hypothetical protein
VTEPTATTIDAQTRTPPSYILLTSESTVQVLSPTVTNDVIYCTIQTIGHNVVASMPIPQGTFESINSSEALTFFARGIEEVMALDNVTAGVGVQTIDASGLIADNLSFTVEYVPPDTTTATTITAEAVVPVSAVMGPSTTPGKPGITEAQAAIDAVYADLQRLAGG